LFFLGWNQSYNGSFISSEVMTNATGWGLWIWLSKLQISILVNLTSSVLTKHGTSWTHNTREKSPIPKKFSITSHITVKWQSTSLASGLVLSQFSRHILYYTSLEVWSNLSKTDACLNGDRCQLQLPVQNITNGVDVLHRRLLRLVANHLPVSIERSLWSLTNPFNKQSCFRIWIKEVHELNTLVKAIDHTCDDGQFRVSAQTCQLPTPTSQKLRLE
jgi:hypothetical protein